MLPGDDKRIPTAMAALRGNGHFDNIVKWLQDALKTARVANDDLEGRELILNQGECRTLKKILEYYDDAADILAKVADREDRQRQRDVRTQSQQ